MPDTIRHVVTDIGQLAVDFLKIPQGFHFPLRVAKLDSDILGTLERAHGTARTVLYQPRFIARELIDHGPGQNERDVAILDHVIQRTQERFLAVVLCQVEPHASVHQHSNRLPVFASHCSSPDSKKPPTGAFGFAYFASLPDVAATGDDPA